MKKSEKRKRFLRLLLISGSSVVLLAAAGVVDGLISHRWSKPELLEKASSAVAQFPDTIGEWESEELEITEQILTVAGASSYAKRMFRNRETGDWIVVTLLCGDHGPISLHPPTICFTGAGWKAVKQEDVAKYSPREGVTAETWQAAFRRREGFQEQEIVADWSWNNGTGWRASDNPRYEFAGTPYLFKLYVISDVELLSDEAGDRREKFINLLLSELDKSVFSNLSTSSKQDGSAD